MNTSNIRPYKFLAMVITVLVVLLTAGSGIASAASSKKHSTQTFGVVGPATPTGKYTTVTLAGPTLNPPQLSNITENVAYSDGYFAKNHLKVVFTQTAGSPLTVAAVESGSAQFGASNIDVVADADAKGAHIEDVGTFNFAFPGEIIASPKVTSLQQLGTVPIAIDAIGATSQIDIIAYAKAHGMNTTSFHWSPTGTPEKAAQYVIGGEATVTWCPLSICVVLMHKDPHLHTLANFAQLGKVVNGYGTVILTTKHYANSHKKVEQEFTTAIVEANRALWHSERTFALLGDTLLPGQYTPRMLKETYKAYRSSYGINGGFVPKVTSASYAMWEKYVDPTGAKSASFTGFGTLMDPSYAMKAVKHLGVIKGWPDTKFARKHHA